MNRERSTRQATRSPPAGIAILLLGAILAACGGGTSTPADTTEPTVQITSPDTSHTANYELTGVAIDNVAITELNYTINGGTAQPLAATGNTFSTNLNLTAGDNQITVTASDAAGNQATDTITVTYLAAPTDVTSSAPVAARGDPLVITGNNLGTTGDLTIGGTTVATDTWTDNQITLTIPTDAPGGPQTVTVSTTNGESSLELFVGVTFEPGELEDLAAENHPKGTAVLLSEGTYTQTTPVIELDNLSLYGQGTDNTILDTDGVPNALIFLADITQDIVISDLTIIGDAILIGPSAPGPIAPLALEDLELDDLLNGMLNSSLEYYASADQLSTQEATRGSLAVVNVTVEGVIGGTGLLTANVLLAEPLLLGHDVFVDNLTFDAPGSALALFTNGDVTVRNSEVESGSFSIASLNGSIDVEGSELFGSLTGVLSIGGIMYSGGLRIVDTTVRSYANTFNIVPYALFAGTFDTPTAAPVEITGSTFHALDAEPAVAPDTGNMAIASSGGEVRISGNTFIAHRSFGVPALAGSVGVYDNTFTIGHPAIAVSPLYLVAPEFDVFIQLTDNSVTWLNQGGVVIAGNYNYSIHDNTFTGNNAGTALAITQNDSSVYLNASVQDNHFVSFENALVLNLGGALADPFDLALNGNHFDFAIDAPGKVATLNAVVQATLDVDDNIWGEEDDLVLLNSYIMELGGTTAHIMTINSALTP